MNASQPGSGYMIAGGISNHSCCHCCRAKLHRSMCIFDQAERDVRHVLETRPQHKGANIELGRVAKAQQSLQTAQAQR